MYCVCMYVRVWNVILTAAIFPVPLGVVFAVVNTVVRICPAQFIHTHIHTYIHTYSFYAVGMERDLDSGAASDHYCFDGGHSLLRALSPHRSRRYRWWDQQLHTYIHICTGIHIHTYI